MADFCASGAILMPIWPSFGFPWVLDNASFRDDLGPTATQNHRCMGPLSAFLKVVDRQNEPISRIRRLFLPWATFLLNGSLRPTRPCFLEMKNEDGVDACDDHHDH